MIETTDLLADVLDETALSPTTLDRVPEINVTHDCDGCGEVRADVELWAEDSESGEELWLCEACGKW